MRNVSDTICRESRNTHFMFNNIFFFENLAVYEIMWKYIVDQDNHRLSCGICASYAGYIRLQPQIQNM